ncbi:MAG TPA: ubiquinol-cytochrome c reductase iron-sulfur subunit [Solirubrobacterales bacterium]|jgi:Rieske Fe-S protein|nr:ubiquinol-cytochrome c reductase iron-sulfur subunit [Solirubrobacterales bacterium]
MPPENDTKKSKYTADRGWPGAFEGETVTRRGFMTGTALGVGGVASALFGLPALGFALGPIFEKTEHRALLDVGPVSDFSEENYVAKVITTTPGIGEAGKNLLYIRKKAKIDGNYAFPYVAISTRCAHLGCPVRYIEAARSFICPCHGGTYDFRGKVTGGPPVRPLDRFETEVVNGRVMVAERFSVNSQLKRVPTRDPGAHVDGLWQILYPPRPTV